MSTLRYSSIVSDSGAQRLSASKVLSLRWPTVGGVERGGVLNAFRHQRFSHSRRYVNPFRFVTCAQRLSASKVLSRLIRLLDRLLVIVLNAFRHQRFSHAYQPEDDEHSSMCSTPFGIKGSLTIVQRRQSVPMLSVLNAFRHQRFSHSVAHPVRFLTCRCAQRLSASKVLSRIDIRCASRLHCMCSTPFGIKGSLTSKS